MPLTEEERRRKIIADAMVAVVAGNGILALQGNTLGEEQVRKLTAADEKYLEAIQGIAPALMPENPEGA